MFKFNLQLDSNYISVILEDGGSVAQWLGRLTDHKLGLFHGDPVFNSSASCQSRFLAMLCSFTLFVSVFVSFGREMFTEGVVN